MTGMIGLIYSNHNLPPPHRSYPLVVFILRIPINCDLEWIGARRGSRIQKGGGVRTFRRGGGVRTGISGADPNCCRALHGQINKQKKIADSRRGGGGVRSPPKKPVSAYGGIYMPS